MSVERKKKIKFLTLFNSFTDKEKIEFSDFIKNVKTGNKRNYNKLLLSLYTDDKGIVEFSEEGNSRTRWNRLSELHLLAEKFLILKSTESNSFMNRFLLMTEYNERNLSVPFEQNYKKLISKISNEPVVNYYYYHISHLDRIYLDHLSSNSDSNNFKEKFIQSGNFRNGIYLIELLEHLIETWSKKTAGIFGTKTLDEEIFEGLNFDNILLSLSGNLKSKNKLYHIIKFLYLIYLSLNNPLGKDNYLKAKKIFFRDLESISKDKRAKFYNHMMEFIIERMNLSIPGAAEEFFFLINKKLKEGLTDDIVNKDLPINKFRDYILTAIALGKYEWANKFIKNYGPLLPADIRDDCVLMGKALVLMHTKKFSACKELLAKIKKKNPFYYVDIFVLKLKVLFEMTNFDECHDELKKFRKYLRKERIMQNHLSVYAKEFCNAYFLLLKLNQTPTKNNLNDLQFLLSKKELIGKKWITLKMNEMKI